MLGLYGDMQMFRSFHLKFNTENSYFEHLHTIRNFYDYCKKLQEDNFDNLNFIQLLIQNHNQEFEKMYSEIEKPRKALN